MRVKIPLGVFYIKTCGIRVNEFEITCSGQYHKIMAMLSFGNWETFSQNRTESQIMTFLIATNRAVSCVPI